MCGWGWRRQPHVTASAAVSPAPAQPLRPDTRASRWLNTLSRQIPALSCKQSSPEAIKALCNLCLQTNHPGSHTPPLLPAAIPPPGSALGSAP